jgi:methylmalonyl-CoA mutase
MTRVPVVVCLLSQDVVVGVNKYRVPAAQADGGSGVGSAHDRVEVLSIDNSAVRASQTARLVHLRAHRDPHAVDAALAQLRRAAEAHSTNAAASGANTEAGRANLLELAVGAARARATLGEISLALEQAWGRHVASTQVGVLSM